MSSPITAPGEDSLVNYQLRLPEYDGPLDVLLRLIERNKLEITDVSLVTVTSQFLDYAASLIEAPEGVIASFAIVGTRLTLLKSRSLLPQPEAIPENDDPFDLARQLVEYRQARDASVALAQRSADDRRSYARIAQASVDIDLRRSAERLGQYSPASLVGSLRRRLSAVPKPPLVVPRRKLVSLRESVTRILELSRSTTRVRFSTVVAPYVSRAEVATTFLAVLVLVKRRAIVAGQPEAFGDIDLRLQIGVAGRGDVGEPLDGD